MRITMMNDSREFTSPHSVPRKAGVLKLVVCVVYVACLAVTGIVSASQSRPTSQAGSAQAPELARLLGTLEQEQWTDWQVPQTAAHQLAEMGGPAVRPIFKAMLASNSNRALHWMEYALYRMAEQYAARRDDPQSPAEILMAALDDRRESYDLRRLSARLLGKLGDGRAVPVLEKNLADRRVASDAARSLGQIRTTDARQALMRRLSVADQALKLEIITSLGQPGDARAFPSPSRSKAVGSAGISGAITNYAESFERGTAVGWEPVNPEDWRVLRDGTNFVYALTRPFPSGVPRRPIQISLLRERTFADFTLTCRVRRPDPKMKSLVLVFGYQDETHFYYAHLSADSSEQARVHNGLFIVDGAPRLRIGTLNAAAILPDTNWHRIRIERQASTGRIALYADVAQKPVLEAVDHRFRSGRIGLGSFGEVGYFDAILIKGILEGVSARPE
ncbi:MAG: HEAT repeat domain-containing protein [Burkholderiales bacterium]